MARSPLDSDLVLDDSVTLSGLDQVTLYHYRVHSLDQADEVETCTRQL